MDYKSLSDICSYVNERIATNDINLNQYISTENMIPNKGGVTKSKKLPNGKTTKAYKKGDILISNIRPYFRKIWHATQEGGCSGDILVVRAKQGVNSRFLYYLLSSDNFFEFDNATSKGTKMPRGDKKAIMQYRIPDLSPENEQKVASILGSLDKRIILNEKINHHLEQMATSIWQEHFDDSEINGTLGDIATISSGKRPPIKSSEITGHMVIPILGANSIMGYTNQNLYDEKILVTGRVGTHGVIQRYNRPCWVSDNALVLKSDFYELAYQILKTIDFVNMNRGSTQPLITQSDLKKVPIHIPTKAELFDFEDTVGSFMNRYEANILENESLTKIHDALLPKLMSGKLSVSN